MNQSRNTRWRAWFYPLTASAMIGLSTPLQADAPFQLKADQSADKYGAIAHFCDVPENIDIPKTDSCGFGYSNNHASPEEANQHAIQKCGVSGCKVIREFTNVCAVTAYVGDSWEHNGKTIGYSRWYWSDPEDGAAIPLLAYLEKVLLDWCNSQIQQRVGSMPGYTFKPCAIVDSSCPTHSPAPVK